MLCSPRFPLWIQDCFLNESFQSKSFCDKRSEVSMTLILRLLSNNLAESELPDLKSLSHRFECVVHFFLIYLFCIQQCSRELYGYVHLNRISYR